MLKSTPILSKVAATLLLLILTTACTTTDQSEPQVTQSTSGEIAEESENVEEEVSDDPGKNDQKVTEKMNYYVGCVNDVSNEIYEGRDRYFERVDPEVGPVGDKVFIWINDLGFADLDSCYEGVEKANAINVETQLNPLAESYVEAVKALNPILEEGNKFYSQDDYRDDPDGSQSQDLHNRYMEALNNFEAKDKALRDEMDKLKKAMDEKLLEELKNEGDPFGYLNQKLMIDAQSLLDTGNKESFAEIDLDQLTTDLNTYENTMNEITTYVQENPSVIELMPSYNHFLDHSAQYFFGEAKNLMRDKRDGTATTESQQISSINQLINSYNSFIESANRMMGYY